MLIHLPEDVKAILHTLQEAGYEAYAVGGCIRDSLLGRRPDDWDITTSAKPQETKALFGKTIDTGIQHGTVTVMRHGRGYEVTTYRVDGEYEDGRHPKEVTFTASLKEDLRRRDFTVNAMAYNEEDGLVDLFGGRQDLEQKIIRCVGEANERFEEDALRIMRAVRFSAQLGFSIEERTKEAIRGHAGRLRQVSAERIQVELTKLVISPNPDFLRIAWETGITAVVLPEFDHLMEQPQNNPHHCFSVGEHTLHAMQAVRPDKCLRLSLLLHDVAKPLCLTTDAEGIDHFHGHAQKGERMAAQILKRLRYDNHTTELVSRLVKWHDVAIAPEKKAVRRAASRMGKELFPLILEVKAADLAAQSDYQRTEKREWLERLRSLYEEIEREGDCLTIKDLAVNGRDLIQSGITPGPQLGLALQQLLEIVLEDPEKNTREYLLSSLPKET